MPLNKAQLMEVPGGPGVTGAVKAGTNITISADGTISSAAGGVTQVTGSNGITVSPSTGNVVVDGSGKLSLTGGTMSGFLQVKDGAQNSLSLNFSGQSGSGIYNQDQGIGFVNRATLRGYFNSQGCFIVGEPNSTLNDNTKFKSAIQVVASGSDAPAGTIMCLRTNDTNQPGGSFIFFAGRGNNPWSPQPLQVGDLAGAFLFAPYTGGSWSSEASQLLGIGCISGAASAQSWQLKFTVCENNNGLIDTLRITAGQSLYPMQDNKCDLGGVSPFRFRSLYLVNSPNVGTPTPANTQTIDPIPEELGLSFINSLNPVTYVKNYDYGNAIGVINQDGDIVPGTQGLVGDTVHIGLDGSEVASLAASAFTAGLGWSGLLGVAGVGDEPNGTDDPTDPLNEWLRYEELVPCLIKSIQQLDVVVEQLKSDFDAYVLAHP